MKLFTTKDSSVFKQLNAPIFKNEAHSISPSFPLYNFKELKDKRLFTIIDNKIMEVEILAWAWRDNPKYVINYLTHLLIKLPNNTTRWIEKWGRFYESLEDLVNERNEVSFKKYLACNAFENANKAGYNSTYGHIMKTFYYSNTFHRVECSHSYIHGLMGVGDEVIALISNNDMGIGIETYDSREEALAAHYNGMEVECFQRPMEINISFQFTPSTPIKMVVRQEK